LVGCYPESQATTIIIIIIIIIYTSSIQSVSEIFSCERQSRFGRPLGAGLGLVRHFGTD
jgi:hypothetical protein